MTARRGARVPVVVGVTWALAMCTALSIAPPSLARRAPGPGGTATLALPAELVGPTLEAHAYVPLIADDDAQALPAGRAPLVSWPHLSSSVLVDVQASDAGRTWRVQGRGLVSPLLVAHAIEHCLVHGPDDAARPLNDWRALALQAAGVVVQVAVAGDDVLVRFSAPFGPVPRLLVGCPLRGPGDAPTGAYAPGAPGRLSWRSSGLDAPPLLGALELRAPDERADVVMGGQDARGADAGAILLAPWPDVVLLVQEPQLRIRDPLGFADPRGGFGAFRRALRADLLAAAYAQGRGTSTSTVLPPGVAPARPLPMLDKGEASAPLALLPLSSSAPRVVLGRAEGDALLSGVVDRLAVLLRARGWALDVKRAGAGADAAMEVVRWRPPTRDPALALLSLVGQRPELSSDPEVARVLQDPRLLAVDDDERLSAALELERALLHARLVVPLLIVDRWLSVDPDLRGVVLRGDGVPVLDGAWWGATP